jgi:CheY-like chemotaxis protein
MTHGPSVLIADGDPDAQIILATIFRHEGFHVLAANTGQKALDLLQADPPSGVITELTLQHVDGLGVLRHVKALWPEVPVIILTAVNFAESTREAKEAGCAAFLLKPCAPQDVVRNLRLALASMSDAAVASGGHP